MLVYVKVCFSFHSSPLICVRVSIYIHTRLAPLYSLDHGPSNIQEMSYLCVWININSNFWLAILDGWFAWPYGRLVFLSKHIHSKLPSLQKNISIVSFLIVSFRALQLISLFTILYQLNRIHFFNWSGMLGEEFMCVTSLSPSLSGRSRVPWHNKHSCSPS